LWADPDLGDASDDYVGSDTTAGLAYAWNGRDFDDGADGYGSKPPAIGYSVVEGFEADDDGLDNNADGQIDESGERMGMTRFMYYLNSSVNLGNPNDGDEAYDYLRGFWRDGMPLTLGGTGHGFSEIPVDFAFPGEPGKFWSEENIDAAGNRNPPGRRKFVLSFGPFTFPAGASKEVVLALTFARGDDRFASVRKLVESIDTVHAAYRDGFGLGFSPTAAESGPDQPPTTNPYKSGQAFQLSAYPNPFTTSVTISYELSEPGDVALAVFDVLGRRVTSLVEKHQNPGRHAISWSGTMDGVRLADGLYILQLEAGKVTQTRSVALAR